LFQNERRYANGTPPSHSVRNMYIKCSQGVLEMLFCTTPVLRYTPSVENRRFDVQREVEHKMRIKMFMAKKENRSYFSYTKEKEGYSIQNTCAWSAQLNKATSK